MHNYNLDIITAYENNGYKVVFIPDFDESIHKRIIRKYSDKAIKKLQEHYLRIRISKIEITEFEKILIIRGYAFSESLVSYIKAKFQESLLFLYQWDPLSISKFDVKALKYFDKCYSFDRNDCKQYKLLSYLPLFYKKFNVEQDISPKPKYDFSFVGSIHTNRFEVLSHLIPQFEENGYTYYIKCYIHIINYYLGCLKNISGYRKFPKKYITFKQIPREHVQRIFSMSNIVIDISHKLQSGLSIRIIEVLGKNKKILTTNKNIKYDSFYSEKMIGILENDILPSNIQLMLNNKPSIDISYLEVNNWINNFNK